MRATRLALAVSIVATLIAGLYFVVYIHRWEMHRALLAGVVFLAGEIALATVLVIRRIDTLRAPAPESRTAHDDVVVVTRTVQPPGVLVDDAAREPATQTEPSRPSAGAFPWLGADRFSVFVPILLGAGTIVSGVAWLVEHLARSTGNLRSARGGRLDRELAALTPPPLYAPVGAPSAPSTVQAAPPVASRGRVLMQIAAGVVVVGLAAVLLALAVSGRSRSDVPAAGTRSVVTMEVRTHNGVDLDVAAESLWGSCRVWLPDQERAELRTLRPGVYQIVLEPALGEHAARRLLGCLNDGTLERVDADLRGHDRVVVGER